MNFTPESLKRWTLPDSYAGAQWPEYFVFLGQHRDSDTVDRSNFISGLAAIGGESETVLVVRESHWAVGWVEWIAIHQDDEQALRKADEIAGHLTDYPVVSDDHLSQLEWDEACEYWERCSVRERVDLLEGTGISVFAARRDEFPRDDSGMLQERINRN